MKGKRLALCVLCLVPILSGCLGTAMQVATVPFKVAGAVVGAVAHTAGTLVGERSESDEG